MSTPSTPDPDDRTPRAADPTPDQSAAAERDAPGPTPPPPSWATTSPDQPSSAASSTAPSSTAPSSPAPAAGVPERTSALGPATGQHAAARPYPPSSPARPEDALTAPLPSDRTADPAPASDAAQTAVLPPAATTPATDAHRDDTHRDDTHRNDTHRDPAPAAVAAGAAAATAAGTTRADLRDADRSRVVHQDLPERPRKPGVGRHLLGTLLGLLLTPVALLLVGIGTARLDDVAGSGDPATDALGLTLLILGTLLLAVIVLLGAWSPAVPIVGGLVWGIGLGVAYLAVPGLMADTVESMVGDRVLPAAVEQLTESAVSGQLLVTGTLLLAAGIATARARRNGRRWAEAVAAADAARADVARRDADRAAAAR